LFPTYEMMDVKEKTERSAGSKGYEEDTEDEGPRTGRYVNSVQKLLNGVRRAEAKARKLEEAQLMAETKWQKFKDSLQKSYVEEKAKFQDKIDTL